MQKVWERLGGENFVLLAVDLREDEGTVRSFVEDSGYTFPVLNSDLERIHKFLSTPKAGFSEASGR